MGFIPTYNDSTKDVVLHRLLTDDDFALICLTDAGVNDSELSEKILKDFRKTISEKEIILDNNDINDIFKPYVNSKYNSQRYHTDSNNHKSKFILQLNPDKTFKTTITTDNIEFCTKHYSSEGVEMKREISSGVSKTKKTYTRKNRVYIDIEEVDLITGMKNKRTTVINPRIKDGKTLELPEVKDIGDFILENTELKRFNDYGEIPHNLDTGEITERREGR